MVTKTIKIKVCDFCGNQDEGMSTCDGCGKDYCYQCSPKDDWQIPDTTLCDDCNNEAYKAITETIERLKKQRKKKKKPIKEDG